MGFIRYKLRSDKAFGTLSFDGVSMSVGEAKHLIAQRRRIDAAELVLLTPEAVLLADDAAQLLSDATVVARRVPVARPRGAARHCQRSGARRGGACQPADPPFLSIAEAPIDPDQENQLIAAVADGYARQWQERGAGAGVLPPSRRPLLPRTHPTLCSRCGALGHYHLDCPTQGDPAFDDRRVRRPCGLPSTMLKRAADGSVALRDGATGCLQPNLAMLRKELACLPTTAAPTPVVLALPPPPPM